MRALFASLPAYGHAAPLCAIAEELARRGHFVAWVTHEDLHTRLLPADAPRFGTGGPVAVHADPVARGRASASVKAFFGQMLPAVTAATLPAMQRAIDAVQPDVVVFEQNCVAASIAARRAGVRSVVVHVTPILLLQPFRVLPGVEAWIDREVGQIQRAAGVEPLPWPLRTDLTLVNSSATFLGPAAEPQPRDRLVGALVRRPTGLSGAGEAERWAGVAGRPRVLVTLGTLGGAAGGAFLRRATAALEGVGTALVATPHDWVDVPAALAEADLLVGHGGQGTVNEALVAGVPLVLAPIQFDQPAVAARVAALGAGRVVSFAEASIDAIRAACQDVLTHDAYRARAREVGASLQGGASRASDLLLGAGGAA